MFCKKINLLKNNNFCAYFIVIDDYLSCLITKNNLVKQMIFKKG